MIKNRIKFSILVLIFLLAVCARFHPYHIHSIKNEPQFYDGKKVIVNGTVVQVLALPFVDRGFCKIDDGTGTIWVKPVDKVVKKGDRLMIRGTVHKGISFGERTFGIIIVEDINE